MTCILAVAHDGKVWMGGDSLAASGFDIAELSQKVFFLGDMIVGASGSVRMGQLIEYSLEIPTQDQRESDMSYLINKFIPPVRELLKQGGYTKVENGIESISDALLIGLNGGIYKMYSDFAICRPPGDFAAIGCGADYALGAISNANITTDNIQSEIFKSIAVSAKFNAGVGPPYYVLSR